MEDCIFCKIAKGEFASAKVLESDEFLAILDIAPIVKGMTVVLTKKHYDSYVFNLPDDVYQRFFLFTKRTVEILKKGLGAERVFLVVEGLDVNHAHIKLYPLKEEKPLGLVLSQGHPAETKKIGELKEILKEINSL